MLRACAGHATEQLLPATELVDLDVVLRLHLTSDDDEEPRIVRTHVTPVLDESSRECCFP
jgi:hypothetical protein